MARSKPLVKAAIALAVLGVLGFLFLRSVRSSRSAPYAVPRAHFGGWTVVAEAAGTGPTAPVLTLRAPAAFTEGLFNQIFRRAMESLRSPPDAGIPLILRGELERDLGGRVTPAALVAAARAAGLDGAPVTPRCVGLRRIANQTSTRQLYFVLFDMPAFARFRREVQALAGGAGGFDPAALSPAMPLAASDTGFDDWLPLRADTATDCLAPIAAE